MPFSTKAPVRSVYDLKEAKAKLEQVAEKLMARKWFKDRLMRFMTQ